MAIFRDVFISRRAPGRDRAQRTRCRFRDPLGLRLAARPVRAVAGRRLAAGGEVDREDIAAGKTMAKAPLPRWVRTAGMACVARASLSAETGKIVPRSTLPCMRASCSPRRSRQRPADRGTRFSRTRRAHVAPRRPHRHRVLQEQMHSLGSEVLMGLNRPSTRPSGTSRAGDLARGAVRGRRDLRPLRVAESGKYDEFEQIIALFQQTSQRLKYSSYPVAAVEAWRWAAGASS